MRLPVIQHKNNDNDPQLASISGSVQSGSSSLGLRCPLNRLQDYSIKLKCVRNVGICYLVQNLDDQLKLKALQDNIYKHRRIDD